MISGKSRIPIKTSNPLAAIHQIEGKAFRVDEQHNDSSANPAQNTSLNVYEEIGAIVEKANRFAQTQSNNAPQTAPVGSESCPTPSAVQGVELNQHLIGKERELAEQEASHQVKVWSWQQEVAQTQQRFDRRKNVLDDQEQNLRKLQFELFQLQNELIESQLATRSIVEGLSVPELQEEALTSLKFELNDRFDQMMLTWREFACQMNELANNLAEQVESI